MAGECVSIRCRQQRVHVLRVLEDILRRIIFNLRYHEKVVDLLMTPDAYEKIRGICVPDVPILNHNHNISISIR